jgi:uroporphyrinogen decarboxylase
MMLEPEFIEDMLVSHTDFSLQMLELCLARGLRFDAVWFFADLCYKNGMLFSPALYRRLVQPCHHRFHEFCTRHGLFLILHCDGDVREFIPLLIEVGFDCIQPLEARAGNDVRQLKGRYGADIAFFGNINMDLLARGDRAEIRHEVVSKVTTAKAGGGYIFHSDHSVPPGVSFDSYRYAVELAKEHGAF